MVGRFLIIILLNYFLLICHDFFFKVSGTLLLQSRGVSTSHLKPTAVSKNHSCHLLIWTYKNNVGLGPFLLPS